MKKSFLLLSLIFALNCCLIAQRSEFKIHPNGLIYNEQTMSKLSHIVDSLNLKFKVCDANPEYFTLPKVKAHYLSIQAGKDTTDALIADLKGNLSIEKLRDKYPEATIRADIQPLVKYSSNEDNQKTVEFISFPGGYYLWNELFEIEKTAQFDKNPTGVWFIKDKKYWRDSAQTEVEAIILLAQPQQQRIAPEYARMIQYGDCVVDTSASLFLTAAHVGRYEEEEKVSREDSIAVSKFVTLFQKKPESPSKYEYKEKFAKKNKIKDTWSVNDSLFRLSDDYKSYTIAVQKWEKEDAQFINKLKNRPDFETLKNNALAVAFKTGYNAQGLDYLINYIDNENQKASLQLKRSYRVVGGCSQDESPRFHLQNIALLSAETANWESFLRAHLDVMNDRVQRVSDGSYAWGRRQTYIRELEELGLDIPKLLIGTCLHMDKPAKNHYFGNVSRIGRALSETKYAGEVETLLFKMVQDPNLDDFNRYICYYIFKNYISYLEKGEKQRVQIDNLEVARKSLPAYIAEKLKKED